MFKKGDVVRYRIKSEGWTTSEGFLRNFNKDLRVGAFRRNNGAIIYGVANKTGKFQIYQGSDGKIRNKSGLDDNKVKRFINFAKICFAESKKN